MGTINFLTSDYITLAIKPYNYDNFANDPEVQEIIKENDYDEASFICDEIEACYEADRENIEYILNEYYNYCYFNVEIKNGYYESLQLVIENNFPAFFEDYKEKQEAQKEVTQLKHLLIECAGVGMVQTFPSWCTGYRDYNGTIEGIKEAIKEIREEIKNTPTWKQYAKETA